MQTGAIARSNDAVWRCITTDIVVSLKELQAVVKVLGVSLLWEGSEDLYSGVHINALTFMSANPEHI